MDEQAVIRAVLAGDPEAFALLIAPHMEMWIRMAASWLGNLTDGEDAVQEALIHCYQHLGQFHQSARFSTRGHSHCYPRVLAHEQDPASVRSAH